VTAFAALGSRKPEPPLFAIDEDVLSFSLEGIFGRLVKDVPVDNYRLPMAACSSPTAAIGATPMWSGSWPGKSVLEESGSRVHRG
jgi:hypothetical protein